MASKRRLTSAQRGMYGVLLLVTLWRVYVPYGWLGPVGVLLAGGVASLCSIWWSRRRGSVDGT